MVSIPALVLLVVGVLVLIPPLLRLRISRLRLGPYRLELSRPLYFGGGLPGAATLVIGIGCLVGAAALAGLLPERKSPVVLTSPTAPPPGVMATVTVSTPTPLIPQDFKFVSLDKATGRVTLTLLQPDTMAGWTVSDKSDFDLKVNADSMKGPINSVACIAFRASGSEIRSGESYRASGKGDWPATGYMFCVSHVGLWSLARFDNGRPTYLKEYQEYKGIRQIKANVLRVRAEGSNLQVWLNDTAMAQVTDATYASGRIQLTCGTPPDEMPAAECNFDGLEITPLP